MSADNFYLIRKNSLGEFTPLMGFASDDAYPEIPADLVPGKDYPSFATVSEAEESVVHEHAEYGITVHPECEVTTPPVEILQSVGDDYVDVRIHLTKTLDESEDYEYLDISGVSYLGGTITEGEALNQQENLVQSDFGSIGFLNAIIDAVGKKNTKFND